jgi:WD40 repeat protein
LTTTAIIGPAQLAGRGAPQVTGLTGMKSAIGGFLDRMASKLPPGDRALLEALSVLVARTGEAAIDADALRTEVETRQGRAVASAAFRQRLKRLNDTLKKQNAPFLLASAGGRISVQRTAQGDVEQHIDIVGENLRRHSDEGTVGAVGASVQPLAEQQEPKKPPNLLVMFSYAWLIDQGTVGDQLHRIQDAFFNELQRQLKLPPARFAHLPPVEIWRDKRRLRTSDRGDPQIKDACQRAFLGLLMLSDKYPHSPNCLVEAKFFLTEKGRNKRDKQCIVVPVNIKRSDVPARFSADNRIWHFDNAGNLVSAWSNANAASRAELVRKVTEEIFQAAATHVAESKKNADSGGFPATASDGGAARTGIGPQPLHPGRHDGVEKFARGMHLEHGPEGTVGPRGSHSLIGMDVGRGAGGIAEAQQTAIEIVPRLADWACATDGPRLTALLGEFGMGKTVTCQLLTQELLARGEDNGPAVPLPLYLDLRNIESPADAGTATLEKIIDDMLRRAGENPPSARDVINYVREREALVIFDGLDEVSNKLTTEQAIKLYRALLSIVPARTWADDAARRRPGSAASATANRSRGPRILVSCRTHFFRDVAAQRSFLSGMDRAGIDANADVQVFLLLPFKADQIEAYLRLHLGPEQAARAIELIGETYDLRQLAERPILLRFIRETFGRIEEEKLAGRTINLCRLYDILVEQTLARDDPKHVIPLNEKTILLRRLAHTLHRDGLSELSHTKLNDWFVVAATALPRLAPVLSGTDGLTQSEIFLQDLRNASLLVRLGDANFRFAHTSIREYFLADALYHAVCDVHAEAAFAVPLPSPETLTFLLGRLNIADEADRRRFKEHFPALLTAGRPVAVRRLAFAIWLASGGTLVRPPEMDLSGLDCFGMVFAGRKDRLLPLQASRWHGARLDQSEFAQADLSGADFSGVRAHTSRWLGCRFPGASFEGADLQGSTWRNTDLPRDLLAGTDLRDAEAVDCRMAGAAWRPRPNPAGRPVGPILLGHGGAVSSVGLGRSGDRDVVVTGGWDGTVRLWDALSGAVVAELSGHDGSVRAIALGRAGNRDVVVSGGDDARVQLWDATSGAVVAKLIGHLGGIRAVALGRAGDRDVVVSGGSDGTVRLWDASSGAVVAELSGHDGSVRAVALGRAGDGDVVVSGGSDGTVRLWDASSGAVVAELSGHRGGVNSAAVGRAGNRDVVVSGGDDGTVRLWDASSGAVVAELSGHGGEVRAVALGRAGDRDIVASGGLDGAVRLWDALSGAVVAELSGHRGSVYSVALGRAGDREVVVSGSWDGTVRLWDALSGAVVAELSGHRGSVYSVSLGRAGDRDVVVSGGGDGTVRLWDASSGAVVAALSGHAGTTVLAVAAGRAGDRDAVVSGGWDGTVWLRDASSGTVVAELGGYGGWMLAVALGRAGDRDVVVSGCSDGTVRLWDASSGAVVAELSGHRGEVNAVALGRVGDRDIVFSGGWDGMVRLWDASSGAVVAELSGHSGSVRALALGRAGDRDVVVSGGSDGTVRLWDASSGAVVAAVSEFGAPVIALAFRRILGKNILLLLRNRISELLELDTVTLVPVRRLIRGPGPETLLDLVPTADGGYQAARLSPDAWRHWRAQGLTEDGRLVTMPIDDMPRAN